MPFNAVKHRSLRKNLQHFLNTTVFFIFSSLSGHVVANTFSHDHLNVKIGQAIFEKLWVFAPASTKSSDGLGPLYNARSCQQCHDETKPFLRQMPPSLVVQLSIEPEAMFAVDKVNLTEPTHYNLYAETGFLPEPTYGKQLQTFAYPGAKSEAKIVLSFSKKTITFSDGETVLLSKPELQIEDLAYGELHPNTKLSVRVAPRMVGLGQLNSIPKTAINALADPYDKNNDGISGKASKVWDPITKTYTLGKFGWKASKASLDQQNMSALLNDIGISSWLFPYPEGDCTTQQPSCIQLAKQTETTVSVVSLKDTVNQPEASKKMTDLLLVFTQTMDKALPNAARHRQTHQNFQQGQAVFQQLQCHSCHQPSFELTKIDKNGKVSADKIWPFSDMLLHDMGEGLSDDRREFQASGREWRTAPLWGIGDYLKKSHTPHFLHDGRAKSVIEAILWHGGEAEQSKRAFLNLPKEQRTNLIEFVESL